MYSSTDFPASAASAFNRRKVDGPNVNINCGCLFITIQEIQSWLHSFNPKNAMKVVFLEKKAILVVRFPYGKASTGRQAMAQSHRKKSGMASQSMRREKENNRFMVFMGNNHRANKKAPPITHDSISCHGYHPCNVPRSGGKCRCPDGE